MYLTGYNNCLHLNIGLYTNQLSNLIFHIQALITFLTGKPVLLWVTLEKICHGFNISLSEFFSFESNPLRNELLSDDEEELLNTYKELSVQNKKLLKAYLDGLCKR
jgi:hypothetical protein